MRPAAPMVLLFALAAVFQSVPPAVAAPTGFDLQSHRGGRGETTEESLRAFAKSLELGVSTLELDIVLTKDGQPWCGMTHGSTRPNVPTPPRRSRATRCTRTSGKLVHDLSAGTDSHPRLRQVAERISRCRGGARQQDCRAARGVRADRRLQRRRAFQHRDEDRGGQARNLGPARGVRRRHPRCVVRAAGKVDKVDIQSFDWRTLPLVQRAEPSIPRVALWDDTTWVPGSPWLGGIDPAVGQRSDRRRGIGGRHRALTPVPAGGPGIRASGHTRWASR